MTVKSDGLDIECVVSALLPVTGDWLEWGHPVNSLIAEQPETYVFLQATYFAAS